MPLVLTQPDRPAGRGRRLTASPVKELALELDLPLAQPVTLARAGPAAEPRPSGPISWSSSPMGCCCRGRCSSGRGSAASTCTRRCCRVGAARRRSNVPCSPATPRPASASCRWMPGSTRGPCTSSGRRRSARTKRPVRSTNGSPLLAAEALLAALPAILAGTSVAVPQQRRARDRRAEDRENRSAARLARASRRARAARARVQPLARRRSALERRPAPARLRSDGRRGPRRLPRRPARSSPPAAPASTSRRARACCVCAESNRRRVARWTSRPISRRTRWREWRLSPEPSPAGAKVRAVAAQLVARVLDERVPADDLLPAAGVDRPRSAAARGARVRCVALALPARVAGAATAHAAARARPGRARRVAAHRSAAAAGAAHPGARSGVCHGRRDGGARAAQRARARERRAAPLSARARAARRRPRCEPTRRDSRTRPGSSTRFAPTIRTIGKRFSRPTTRRRRCGCASICCARRARPISTSSRRPGWPRSPRRTSSPPCVSPSRSAWTRCRGSRRARCRCRTCRRSMPPRLLELDAGQRVLDACAAPGGKTGHILEAMSGRGEIWAVDRDAARLDARARQPGASRLDGDARQRATRRHRRSGGTASRSTGFSSTRRAARPA